MTPILPSDDITALNPASLSEGFTQSELTVFDICPEKWYRGYNQLLRRKGLLQWWSVYGTAMHSSLESFYINGDGSYELATLQIPDDIIMTAEDERELRYFTELLALQMERYAKYYINDFEEFTVRSTEQILRVKHEGLVFQGKVDINWQREEYWGPCDHKTTGMFGPEVTKGWNFRFQFLFYAWLLWKSTGEMPNAIWWNGIRKPALRQNKNESFESFMVRIEGAMRMEPEKYMIRQFLPLEAEHLQHFETRNLGPKLAKLRLLTDSATSDIIIEALVRDMHNSSCIKYGKPCEFMGLCEYGQKDEGAFYVRRETKHEELEAE